MFLPIRRAVRQRRNVKEGADLTSVQELLAAIDQDTHAGLLCFMQVNGFINMNDTDDHLEHMEL